MLSKLKPLYLLFVLAGLIACGDEVSVEDTATTPATSESTNKPATSGQTAAEEAIPSPAVPTPNAINKPWTGDFDAMADRRVIRVLTVYSAGRYYLDGPEEKGLVYEMFKQFEETVNKTLKSGHLKVHVLFIPVARSQLIPALLEGRGDIISAGLTITAERAELVDFSEPVSKPVKEILVTGPAADKLNTIDDLAGKTIFVRPSSSYRESVEELNRRFTAENKPPIIMEPISELLEDDDLIEMVNSGLLPWAIVDGYKTQLWEGVFDKLVVRDDIVFRSGARIGYALRKDSPKLEAQLNKFLKTHRQGTLLGNMLTNRYLRDFDWAANALAQSDYKRFEDLESIFKTYGEKYGIEYLLVAAQGYQESRLKQSARSRAGAVGVMQLLPATAKDKNVGISNIDQTDPNIHAGVKYLDFLRDRYFSDPEITELNRNLLALAAYNAGPSRMINLRNKAEKLGYDRNVWFDNVEVIAAMDIGRETVQYVANIYKYYLSYQLTAAQQLKHKAARQSVGID
jgi:membrane-bound lytic murein transglycosylase MltF